MAWLALALAIAVASLLIVGMRYQRAGNRRDERRLPPPGRLIDVGGRRLHLHTLGEGSPTIVFESGLAASSLNWRPVQEAVATFARACAYDRAGYGWSDRAPGPRTARAAVADLHRLLRAADVPPPYILVGHSFGTYIVPLFAAEHPEDVAGVVLVDPITPDEWIAPDRERRRRVAGGLLFSRIGGALASVGLVRFLLDRRAERPALSGAVLGAFGREADRVVRRVVGEVTKMPRELWPAVQAHWSRADGFRAMAQHFRALQRSAAELKARLAPRPDGAPPLGDMPLVVISAANCSDDRVEEQRALAMNSARGSHRRAVTGGHWVQLDEPALVIDVIRALVDRDRQGERPGDSSRSREDGTSRREPGEPSASAGARADADISVDAEGVTPPGAPVPTPAVRRVP